MQCQLILDQPGRQFTNLDYVSGRVVLRVPKPSSVSFVVVKLEGECTSRLDEYDAVRNKQITREETHKVESPC